jgi:hypothetical protein
MLQRDVFYYGRGGARDVASRVDEMWLIFYSDTYCIRKEAMKVHVKEWREWRLVTNEKFSHGIVCVPSQWLKSHKAANSGSAILLGILGRGWRVQLVTGEAMG